MAIKAQLFITCLTEQFFPRVLKDMVAVLERLGVQCEFPEAQTCCGQPLKPENQSWKFLWVVFNSGKTLHDGL